MNPSRHLRNKAPRACPDLSIQPASVAQFGEANVGKEMTLVT